MRSILPVKTAFLFLVLISLAGCASSGANPYGENYQPDSPALPIDPHAAQPGTFSNRTDHTVLSD